jgi:uncharacterized integral membrane protein
MYANANLCISSLCLYRKSYALCSFFTIIVTVRVLCFAYAYALRWSVSVDDNKRVVLARVPILFSSGRDR